MPYKDQSKARAAAKERSRRYRQRKRDKKYGPNAPDQRGRQGNSPRGEQHYRWNDRLISSQGYVLVRVPKDHPLHVGNGYAYEHRMVASTILGRMLASDDIVHHVNGDRADNRPENLQVLQRGEHNHLHLVGDERRDSATGQFTGKHETGRILDGRTWDEYPQEVAL